MRASSLTLPPLNLVDLPGLVQTKHKEPTQTILDRCGMVRVVSKIYFKKLYDHVIIYILYICRDVT